MAEDRPVIHVSTAAVVVCVVVLLGSLIALAAINSGVAIILVIFAMIFGGELLDRVTTGLDVESSSQYAAESAADDDAGSALEVLRQRYAAGDLSDAEFERKLETLVATETVADVDRYVDGSGGDAEPDALEPEPELERG
ncbi:SHOCT domain-containing protein [Natrarchaeobaculum sulfurireducens]|uniref:SHOCT domain-containing protein n=1 Tax=Natrarchaeobaculum sulfurireducens TaxID=2044521 RepID=A0A346PJB7_9EURY|nr:SHOCT domain-containing protein [Natrarchaeobaculum sulfurireducens]AXR79612.1 hypothetical protein AArc1_3311 [Natrarchaeobaculum sulfurireducens]AXR83385.1 hypothetical protein AArcMg_3405 [Natrarchaeobaculum sulfurireducens]